MKSKIYNYVNDNKNVEVIKVANGLKIPVKDVFKIMEELRVEGFLKMCSPKSLDVSSDSSCFYTVTGKKYSKD